VFERRESDKTFGEGEEKMLASLVALICVSIIVGKEGGIALSFHDRAKKDVEEEERSRTFWHVGRKRKACRNPS